MTSSRRWVRSRPVGRSNSAWAERQGLLGPGDALTHGGLGREEPASDLGGGEPADQAQRERGPGLRREGGVAGQEDEPQHVVLDVVDLAVEVGHLRLLSSTRVLDLRDLAPEGVGAPEVVDAAPLRGGHQPCGRVVRYAGGGPLLQRSHQGVLREIRGELHVAGHPHEGADEAGRIGPPRGMDGLDGVVSTGLRRHVASVVSRAQAPGASGPSEIWRSVEITVTSGQCFACSSAKTCMSATASSRVAYSRIDQPPTTSLASA